MKREQDSDSDSQDGKKVKKVHFAKRSHTPKPVKNKAMNLEESSSARCFSPQRGASISI